MNATKSILRFTLFVLSVTLAISVPAYSQVPSNVLVRTRLIQTSNGATGTAFTIDVDGRQYLITAKHLVDSITDGAQATINIRKRDSWSTLLVTVFKCNDPIDVAVLVPPTQVTLNYPLESNHAGLTVGGDVYFVGFPFGKQHAITYPTMSGVFGIVKRAIVAQLDYLPALQTQRIMLDGINNEGFSGSPVVFRDFSLPGYVFKVAGVIVAYEAQTVPVYSKIEIKEQDIAPADIEQQLIMRGLDGKAYRLKDTGQVVKSNTGIATAWDIGPAVDLIRKHPIGPTVSDKFSEGQSGY